MKITNSAAHVKDNGDIFIADAALLASMAPKDTPENKKSIQEQRARAAVSARLTKWVTPEEFDRLLAAELDRPQA